MTLYLAVNKNLLEEVYIYRDHWTDCNLSTMERLEFFRFRGQVLASFILLEQPFLGPFCIRTNSL